MTKFISLLRGINFSGQKQIKMSALKLLFEELRFHNVETYIQSGNVIFLSSPPSKADIKKLDESDFSPEEFIINGRYLYLFVSNGYGKAKLNNNFFESKLKVQTTTRNWKTVNKLVELSKIN